MKYISIVLATIVALLPSTAHAAVWYVHPDSVLNTIQAALNGCSADDTILVGAGHYYETIEWPSTGGIDLVSEYGPDTTIIDGDSLGRVVNVGTVQDTSTLIKGFTIQRGYAGRGAGIRCSNSSSLRIYGNIITNNVADSVGGGISMAYSAPIIDSNTVIMNTCVYYGGGIGIGFASDPKITRNLICDNVAVNQHGGGIMSGGVGGPCSPTITDDTIINNTAGGSGGGLMVVGGQPYINGNVISDNHANMQGGGITCSGSMAAVSNNMINLNTAGSTGGGVRICSGGSPEISYNEITGNTAPIGGGIYCDDQYTSPTIRHNMVTGNTAAYFGAGIHSEDSASPHIDSCIITNNIGDGVSNSITSTLSINYCNIFDNTGYAVRNFDQYYTLDAEYNWWGDASGPYHPTANPGGLGGTVSDYVDFDPWLPSAGVEEYKTIAPLNLHLQVTPNPFHFRTEIRYSILDAGYLIQNPTLSIYDASGRSVKAFYLESNIQNQESLVVWHGDDNADRKLPSGIYFVQLSAGNTTETKKVLLVR